jgi:hypothetical protein
LLEEGVIVKVLEQSVERLTRAVGIVFKEDLRRLSWCAEHLLVFVRNSEVIEDLMEPYRVYQLLW